MSEKHILDMSKEELFYFKKKRLISGKTYYFTKFDVEFDNWLHCFTYHNAIPHYVGGVTYEGMEDDALIMDMFNKSIESE